jgi:hypothetical protein
MRHSPHAIYEHLKEAISSYLDTAYRISHPLVAVERAALLRKEGVVTQLPCTIPRPFGHFCVSGLKKKSASTRGLLSLSFRDLNPLYHQLRGISFWVSATIGRSPHHITKFKTGEIKPFSLR